MSAISVPVSSELPGGAVMPASRLLNAYLTEAKYESVRMLRAPAFDAPCSCRRGISRWANLPRHLCTGPW